MKERTNSESRAYAEGYKASYQQFLAYLKGKYTKREAIDRMRLIVEAVSSTLFEKESEDKDE